MGRRWLISYLSVGICILPTGGSSQDLQRFSTQPSFNCDNARSAVAKIICSDESGVKADWDVVSAYWARLFSLADSTQQEFDQVHGLWLRQLHRACKLDASKGTFSLHDKQCVLDAYSRRAAQYRITLADDALAESTLSAQDHALIQYGLLTLGYLQNAAQADGEFGPTTRAAIRLFNEKGGVRSSVFLANRQREVLLDEGRTKLGINVLPSPSSRDRSQSPAVKTPRLVQMPAVLPLPLEKSEKPARQPPSTITKDEGSPRSDTSTISGPLSTPASSTSKPTTTVQTTRLENTENGPSTVLWAIIALFAPTILMFLLRSRYRWQVFIASWIAVTGGLALLAGNALLFVVPTVVLGVVAFHWLPTITAFRRRHPDRWIILVLNSATGVSIIGWIIAMVWARGHKPIEPENDQNARNIGMA